MKAEQLTYCTNCSSILIDTNPLADAQETELSFEVYNSLQELESFTEDDMEFEHGCPNCETDEYLTDRSGEYTHVINWLDKNTVKN